MKKHVFFVLKTIELSEFQYNVRVFFNIKNIKRDIFIKYINCSYNGAARRFILINILNIKKKN